MEQLELHSLPWAKIGLEITDCGLENFLQVPAIIIKTLEFPKVDESVKN